MDINGQLGTRCNDRKIMPHESLLWKWGSWGKILVILKTQQELQHLGALTLKLPICRRPARREYVGEERKRRWRGEGEERTQRPLNAPRGAGFVILITSLESLLAEHMIPTANCGPHRALTISSAVPRLYLYLKLTLTAQLEKPERVGGQETALWESVCVVCACVRVLNNFMDICHAQLTLHCCILSCRPRLGRQW